MSAQVFVKLFAIFAVVAIGWGAAKSGRLGSGDPARVLAGAAFYVFVPALLFRTSARIDFERLDVRIVLAFFLPTLAVMAVVYLFLRLRRGAERARRRRRACGRSPRSFGNAVQVGIPLAAALYGEAGLALHITLVSLHALILLTVLTALVELDLARADRDAAASGQRLLRTLGDHRAQHRRSIR